MMQHLSIIMRFLMVQRFRTGWLISMVLGVLHDDGLRGLLALLRREIMTRSASILIIDGIVAARTRRRRRNSRSTSSFVSCRR